MEVGKRRMDAAQLQERAQSRSAAPWLMGLKLQDGQEINASWQESRCTHMLVHASRIRVESTCPTRVATAMKVGCAHGDESLDQNLTRSAS